MKSLEAVKKGEASLCTFIHYTHNTLVSKEKSSYGSYEECIVVSMEFIEFSQAHGIVRKCMVLNLKHDFHMLPPLCDTFCSWEYSVSLKPVESLPLFS